VAEGVQVLVGLMILAGSFFAVVAAIGLVRFDDVYMRMHAASKAGTLGAGLLLLALAVESGEFGIATRAIAGVVFLMLTAPVSAHLLARSAYLVGYKPCEATKHDALADRGYGDPGRTDALGRDIAAATAQPRED
jgi:multicomponent Na+:H+ antiporter subunit G